MIDNYMKCVDARSRLVAVYPFDSSSEASAIAAWGAALTCKQAREGRRVVLGAPMAIRGPWDSIAITGVEGRAAVAT